jgi:predicted outer membrane protein
MRMMVSTLALVACTIAVLAADKADKKPEVKKDSFLTQALGNALSLERFSALAMTKANNADVKEFAKDLNEKAVKCRKKLEDAAKESKTGVLLGLEKGRQAKLVKMGVMTGETFDKEFIAQVISDLSAHCKLLKDNKDSDNKTIKAICADSMKDCQDGLDRANKLQAKIGKPAEKTEK